MDRSTADQRRPARAGCGGACSSPAVEDGVARGPVTGYLRRVEPVVRGWVGVVSTVVVFGAGSALSSGIGERVGLLVVSAWVLLFGTYCALNFWHCRETHCVVTGAGWTPLSLLGFAAVLSPGTLLTWFRVETEVGAFLVILAIGAVLECAVVARTGRRQLR